MGKKPREFHATLDISSQHAQSITRRTQALVVVIQRDVSVKGLSLLKERCS